MVFASVGTNRYQDAFTSGGSTAMPLASVSSKKILTVSVLSRSDDIVAAMKAAQW